MKIYALRAGYDRDRGESLSLHPHLDAAVKAGREKFGVTCFEAIGDWPGDYRGIPTRDYDWARIETHEVKMY